MPTDNELERLINEYGNTLLRMCYLFLKDYQLAEDAVQETFIKVMKSYETFKHKSSEKTWITRIAINVCKNEMRGGWFRIRKNNDFDEDTIGEKTFEDAVVDRDSLSRAIMRLNDVDREIIILYYYQELHIKEIAPIMHISENTALQRLRRARGKLKKNLVEDGYEC
ncbi:sigma-70 family RNA polymerase sigma factor [Lachnospiraceae bacterium DSM 108991]|uniref:Sigma-70 family RNA polymerase sigma factor n=1 Tax=Claveliimonas monacensis TaxID=2779351 RepID=A0ABR9RLV0_9FIRM|nr:sigma-70 family RNA polymerase sigma factor [Claveliimonas monacensis]MBE5063968.1 sigma-70 family RNA polymerase sigma factor [Claveliimonas monacensis]